MINLYATQIQSISLHHIGNKSKAEPIFLSKEPFNADGETNGLLKEFFLKPFREKEEYYYRLTNEVDVEFNEVYKLVSEIFEKPEKSHDLSLNLTKHLYNQSNHPHIKSGEIYITYLTDILLDNEKTDAIGIFKSEIKQDFMQFAENGANLDLLVQKGININKLDKGCLIFNVNKSDGYKVLS
ncbi:MAG: nucleoid-associated protein, partial [Eudoraea sp.]|nr:nucleoid-associated protein [Eudoraea sp.]